MMTSDTGSRVKKGHSKRNTNRDSFFSFAFVKTGREEEKSLSIRRRINLIYYHFSIQLPSSILRHGPWRELKTSRSLSPEVQRAKLEIP
ncbi:hypothetical protein BDBG_16659 [Blastomyces gilchristii SLH14081]|uniref:Uncharacterized protein n=1 Tax=Blastomyces gilchristii (strain SLH14081) TaxID=559298 RepID=A0A179UHZ4_BLAGS|nr:uncharacterized protein BDBG_16659 [Blastomyces gilchristii SLH14081]OAT06641.1 hypothetical protein BDBG_16659 [Blastomyces gilchristii SLH14081]